MNKPFTRELLISVPIFIFAYTGLDKLVHHEFFRVQLLSHHLLKNHAILISWALPVIEIIVALLMFFHTTRRVGLLIGLSLMSAFTAYLLYLVTTAPHLPCSCAGIFSFMSWNMHIIFNVACALLILLLVITRPTVQNIVATNRGIRKPAKE
ncbi:MAG: MauE/DoxX family redox-associated membrane protein [Chitinophagaceae bacterium]